MGNWLRGRGGGERFISSASFITIDRLQDVLTMLWFFVHGRMDNVDVVASNIWRQFLRVPHVIPGICNVR